MKKISSLLLLMVVLVLTSCSEELTTENAINKYVEQTSSMSSYTANIDMEIIRGDKTISFEVDVDFLSPDYYKVQFVNKDNNNKQILLRNDDGVYALTPSLNKQYKFESDWPNNTNHVYLANLVANVVSADEDSSVVLNDTEFEITSKLDIENEKYETQVIYVDCNTLMLKKVCFLDSEQQEVVKATYNVLGKEKTLIKNDFNADMVMEDSVSSLGEGSVSSIIGDLNVSYVVEGCTSSSMTNDEVIVINYSGDYNYIVICQDILEYDTSSVSRIYMDFDLSSNGLMFFNQYSATTFIDNKEITVIGYELSQTQMNDILDSITFV